MKKNGTKLLVGTLLALMSVTKAHGIKNTIAPHVATHVENLRDAALFGNARIFCTALDTARHEMPFGQFVSMMALPGAGGNTILQNAILGGNAEVVQRILEIVQETMTTAQVFNLFNFESGYGANTILEQAALSVNPKIIHMILRTIQRNIPPEQAVALFNHASQNGFTALMIAASTTKIQTALMVLEAAREIMVPKQLFTVINFANKYKETVLFRAIIEGNTGFVCELLEFIKIMTSEQQIDIISYAKCNKTPFVYAIHNQRTEIALELLVAFRHAGIPQEKIDDVVGAERIYALIRDNKTKITTRLRSVLKLLNNDTVD